LVTSNPQDVVVFILNTAQEVVGYHRETHHFSEGKSAKEFTAPQHTRFILPPIHPTKSIAALRGRYFSFSQIKSYVVV
jgi:hypothetical protein